jgi:hypothetical protein
MLRLDRSRPAPEKANGGIVAATYGSGRISSACGGVSRPSGWASSGAS